MRSARAVSIRVCGETGLMVPHQAGSGSKISRVAALAKSLGISTMTLYRWELDPRLDFPAPVRSHRRKFWSRTTVDAWMAAQAKRATHAKMTAPTTQPEAPKGAPEVAPKP